LVPPWTISSKTIRSFSALYDIGPAPPYSVASMTGSSVSSTSKILSKIVLAVLALGLEAPEVPDHRLDRLVD
jgi:hypothetical protein